MASKKSKGATLGALVGARLAPKAGKAAGRTAWRTGKGQARPTRRAVSSQEPAGFRFLKYGFFALVGLVVGALISRFGRDGGTPGETWGTGTPTGASPAGTHQRTEDPNRTGAERAYSDPSTGPLIGEQHRGDAGDVPMQHEEVENRIRTHLGEDPRTREMPSVNVEVNDGVAELRGVAPTEEAKAAAGEIASSIEGVREVRNLITVS